MTAPRKVFALLLTLASALLACTPYPKPKDAPVAVAGEDLMLAGASVQVMLDGSESYDPDGDVVRYEWRYTGWPAGFMPAAPPAPMADEDGGMPPPVPPPPTNPTLDPLAPPPPFCLMDEVDPMQPVQIRYCLVSREAKTTITLTPGGYRFTLYVEDDQGMIAADTLDVLVEP